MSASLSGIGQSGIGPGGAEALDAVSGVAVNVAVRAGTPEGVRHVAIIMDGNGRWAKQRMMPRGVGHRRGVGTVRDLVRAASDMGLVALTLYAFSSENWRRSAEEVSDLMGLLKRFIISDLDEMHANGIRLRIIGDYKVLAPDLVAMLEGALARTAGNGGMILAIALNYGSQQEIARAAASAAAKGAVTVNGVAVGARDGAGIVDEPTLSITATEDAELVMVEVAKE